MEKANNTPKSISTPVASPIYPKELIRQALPPPGVKLDYNVYVPMRDGVKLAVDVYRPETEGRYPALLSYSAYTKEIQQQQPNYSHAVEAGATYFYVPKGYVHIIAQARGSGFSQGQYKFFDKKEQQDGYDLVEWIAQRPWCNGNVSMIGDSYFAMIQFLVAAQIAADVYGGVGMTFDMPLQSFIRNAFMWSVSGTTRSANALKCSREYDTKYLAMLRG